jgi:hypothetical protein
MHTRGLQWELLQNGIKREDLELDSEIDKTAICFPTSYDADDLKVIQGKTHAELLRLFTVFFFKTHAELHRLFALS